MKFSIVAAKIGIDVLYVPKNQPYMCAAAENKTNMRLILAPFAKGAQLLVHNVLGFDALI